MWINKYQLKSEVNTVKHTCKAIKSCDNSKQIWNRNEVVTTQTWGWRRRWRGGACIYQHNQPSVWQLLTDQSTVTYWPSTVTHWPINSYSLTNQPSVMTVTQWQIDSYSLTNWQLLTDQLTVTHWQINHQ